MYISIQYLILERDVYNEQRDNLFADVVCYLCSFLHLGWVHALHMWLILCGFNQNFWVIKAWLVSLKTVQISSPSVANVKHKHQLKKMF